LTSDVVAFQSIDSAQCLEEHDKENQGEEKKIMLQNISDRMIRKAGEK
jgi:hypothetical protein